jgi:signal transduction histidine kinase
VKCDPGLIKLVFANLLSNAVKYTGKRGVARISISMKEGPDGRVFAVSDNGAGFDQRYHPVLIILVLIIGNVLSVLNYR